MEVKAAKSNPWLAGIRTIGILLTSFILLLAYYLTFFMAWTEEARIKRVNKWAKFWGKSLTWISGITVKIIGGLPESGYLITPNHLGYGDILGLLGKVKTFFIGKSEIADWPIIGTLFRHSKQIVVPRQDKKGLARTIEMSIQRLELKQSVCVFLEGTSSGGEYVLPFKPSLLESALRTGKKILPVAICWKPKDPDIDISEDLAYWKDHHFGPHAWRFMGLRGKHLEIIIGDPVDPHGFDRRELANLIREEVVKLYNTHRLK